MLFIPVLFSLCSIDTQSQHSILLGINILPQKIIKIKYHSKPKIIDLNLLFFFKSKKFPFIPVLLLAGLPKKIIYTNY